MSTAFKSPFKKTNIYTINKTHYRKPLYNQIKSKCFLSPKARSTSTNFFVYNNAPQKKAATAKKSFLCNLSHKSNFHSTNISKIPDFNKCQTIEQIIEKYQKQSETPIQQSTPLSLNSSITEYNKDDENQLNFIALSKDKILNSSEKSHKYLVSRQSSKDIPIPSKGQIHPQQRVGKSINSIKLFSETLEKIELKQKEALEFVKTNMQLSTTPRSKFVYSLKEDMSLEFANLLKSVKQDKLAEVVKIIDENPELIDHKDFIGESALHWACKRGFSKIVEFLLNRGANSYLRNINHKTAKELAIEYKQSHLLSLFTMLEMKSCRVLRKNNFVKVLGAIMMIQRWYRANYKRKLQSELLYQKRFLYGS